MRRALVTGGANGIGAATVRKLTDDGFNVTFCDRDAVAGAALAAETGTTFTEVDAVDFDAVARFFNESDPFDVLVNNVGVDQHSFFSDTGPSDWRHFLAVNLESAFAFTLGVLPGMQSARYGRIVNVSSEAGRLGSRGGAIYASAKAGLLGFTCSIARENARYGVTANAVLPGPIETPMVTRAVELAGERMRSDLEGLTLLRRMGRPEEVAAAIAFLCSEDAGFITGESLGVSGGMGCSI